jgi:hypothetical protein
MRVKLWGVRGSLPAPVSAEAISRKIEMAIWKARNLKLHRSANAKYDQSQKKIIDDFLSSLSLDERGTVGGNTPCVQIMPADDKVIIVDCGSGLRSLGEELMRGDMKKGNGTASIFISHTH